jgi:ubiquinone biosynthesis protein COQ4
MSAAPPPPQKVQWRQAWRALQTLIDDPERTEQVFELIRALAGQSGERLFQRFQRHPEGRRLLDERPDLLATLSDAERLAALPVGSFGRSYAEFMEAGRLRAKGLVEAADAVRQPEDVELDPERRWFYDRLRDMHDLWHVLTGYGRDVAGEAANLAFTHAQTRNRGVGVIVLAAAWLGPKTLDCHWQRYLLRCWLRGRRTTRLVLARYEELMSQPLEEVRRELGIEPPETAHPGGVLAFEGDPAAVT